MLAAAAESPPPTGTDDAHADTTQVDSTHAAQMAQESRDNQKPHCDEKRRRAGAHKRDRSGRTPLFKAASKTDGVDTMRALVDEDGADVHARDFAGWSVLHEACLAGNIDAVRFLLARNAFVNAQAMTGDTPLHDAIDNAHVAIIKMLLEHGVNIRLKNDGNVAPIDRIADLNDDHLRTLFEQYAHETDALCAERHPNTGKSLLHDACAVGDDAMVKRLVWIGADVNARDHQGSTPLHEAAQHGHLSTVRFLLQAGADLAIADNNGQSAVDIAHHAVVDLLRQPPETIYANDFAQSEQPAAKISQPLSREERKLQSYVDLFEKMEGVVHEDQTADAHDSYQPRKSSQAHSIPRKQSPPKVVKEEKRRISLDPLFINDQGQSQLHLNAISGHLAAVKSLIKHDCPVDLKDNDGYTALHLAVLNNKMEVAKVLLDNNAKVATTNNFGRTILHDAVKNIDLVILLLSIGVDIFAKDKEDKLAVDLADNQDVRRLLLDKMDDLKPRPPMLKAARSGDMNSLRDLLNSPDTNLNETDDDGLTALHLAVRHHHRPIIEFLVRKGADFRQKDKTGQSAWDIADESIQTIFAAASKRQIEKELLNDMNPAKRLKDLNVNEVPAPKIKKKRSRPSLNLGLSGYQVLTDAQQASASNTPVSEKNEVEALMSVEPIVEEKTEMPSTTSVIRRPINENYLPLLIYRLDETTEYVIDRQIVSLFNFSSSEEMYTFLRVFQPECSDLITSQRKPFDPNRTYPHSISSTLSRFPDISSHDYWIPRYIFLEKILPMWHWNDVDFLKEVGDRIVDGTSNSASSPATKSVKETAVLHPKMALKAHYKFG